MQHSQIQAISFEHARRTRAQSLMRLTIGGLLAAALLSGVALAQMNRAGQSANVAPSVSAPIESGAARLPARAPGDPSPFGYHVYDWEGPVPTFSDF